MTNNDSQFASRAQHIAAILKNWITVGLISIFILLYVAALFGWVKPLGDFNLISRLEPIIFIIIGYYFGRLLAIQIEKTLKAEITRQTQKADAAQHIKEQAQQQNGIFEEKLRNVEAALRADTMDIMSSIMPENGGHSRILAKNASNRGAIGTALKILDS